MSQPPTEQSAAELLKRVNCSGLVVTGQGSLCTGQLLEQCLQETMCRATKFYFSKPGLHLSRHDFARLQKDLTAWVDLHDSMLYYSTRFRCNSNTHNALFTKTWWGSTTGLVRELVLYHACINVAFAWDGCSCNRFSHLKTIHFHQRITHPAHWVGSWP